MFAVTPYAAEYENLISNKAGYIESKWTPCHVLGVKDGDDGPEYVIEVYSKGTACLTTAGYVRPKQ